MVDPLKRLTGVEKLIEKEMMFTIHAPRQTGKTTYLHALADKLNSEGKYIALLVSFEEAGYGSISVKDANETLIHSIYNYALQQLPAEHLPENPAGKSYGNLKSYMQSWCTAQPKPVILLIDEIDSLLDDVLVSVLRQLRSGFQGRPKYFPSSVVLVGLRDVRDYKVRVQSEGETLGTASPFNVKARSLLMKDFSKQDVLELLEQHETETGQEFPAAVKEEIFRLTQGQPWLTNALANMVVADILKEDFSREIDMEILRMANRRLILQRDTHLDSLVDRLKEERVKKVVQAIINGDILDFDILDDDIAYVRDLGIVSPTSPLIFANPIYAEIVPRVMAASIQESIPADIRTRWFIKENNPQELDMKKILMAFQEFYRENAESWLDRFAFKESAHHLLLMAFLQRVVNAGGDISREMAVGNGRVDLLVRFHDQETALELKTNRGKRSIEKGKEQLAGYLDRLGLSEGYLVLFDNSNSSWEEKIYIKESDFKGKKLHLVGI